MLRTIVQMTSMPAGLQTSVTAISETDALVSLETTVECL
jgi:hypothetical protein